MLLRSFLTALAALLATMPATAAANPAFANRCLAFGAGGFVVAGEDGYATTGKRSTATPFHAKPTGPGGYLLHDENGRLLAAGTGGEIVAAESPGAGAQWRLAERGRRRTTIRSADGDTAVAVRSGRLVAVEGRGTRFRVRRASGCTRFPEAKLNTRRTGSPNRKRMPRMWGLADPHVHPTASLRAGGEVIAGEVFHPFGVIEALGRDADKHGPDGSLDFTGNLMRGGSPAGTHDTGGWPSFAGWPVYNTYTHQQIYYRWLQRAHKAGWRLIVAQTIEDEPLCQIEPRTSHSCDEMDTVELEVEQLRDLEAYVDSQHGGPGRGWFRLVYGPGEARDVIRRGKLAVVIGAETSNPFGCSQFRGTPHCDRAQIDAGIDRMHRIGVRGMFLAHWVDNALSGASIDDGANGMFIAAMQSSYTGEPFTAGPCPYPDQGAEVPGTPPGSGKQCNVKSLTELGEYAVARMMDKHMLIEVDHMSERARNRMLEIAEERNYPLVSSHTGSGGHWNDEELRRLFRIGGFAAATLSSASKLPEKVLRLRGTRSRRGGIGLATDTGGFASFPGPDAGGTPLEYPFRSVDGRRSFDRQQTGTRAFDLNADGVAHYGMLPDHLARVHSHEGGEQAVNLLFDSARAYVRTWRRTGAR